MRDVQAEIAETMRRESYFHRLKVGDKVKVPVKNRICRVQVAEKYPHHFLAVLPNGYRSCFNKGDVVTTIDKVVGSKVNEE